LMMSLWDALRMNMMISYQELVRTFLSFKLDEDTHLKLVNAKERSGRSKAGEVVLRVKDHLLRYPDFYPTVTYKSVSFGPVVMARFDEDTNKKLIAAKNKSNRSKSHEVYLRLKAHLFEFPDFYSSEVEVIRRSVSET
ncbi:TraY domain-containing protein, partial [Klebsiella pneumoniae]